MATGIPVSAAELVDLAYMNEVARAHWRKTTAKIVNTTVAATDLLNGEITIDAGAMSTTRCLRLTAWGDWLQNSGGAAAPPRFQLLLGGTTLIDTGTSGSGTNAVTRFGWKLVAEITNLGSASSQIVSFQFRGPFNITGSPNNAFTTGEGAYSSINNGVASMLDAAGVNATTVNTALASALVLNVINGSASASYEMKIFAAIVEVV